MLDFAWKLKGFPTLLITPTFLPRL
uniref:Uncharacterized protein n=1 Tax=Rhizophora mucronata TaxID=61149 RepID=A0A2P2PXZ7_RHIMU